MLSNPSIVTDAQVDTTQMVLELDSFDDTKARILALSDAQWAAQLIDNGRWTAAGTSKAGVKKVGSIEFFGAAEAGTSNADLKAEITRNSRRRFGLPDVNSFGNFPTTLNWMGNGCY